MTSIQINGTHSHCPISSSSGLFWPKIFRRFVFGLIIAQATITGQFILKDARHEAYATIALMFLTYIFLRSTRARYDATSSFLPLEVATVMDISLGHDEEMKQQRRHDARNMHQQQQYSHISPTNNANVPINIREKGSSSLHQADDDESIGNLIGESDPFELAYVQPVIRASPHARPEQPFPPAQLGREELLAGNSLGSTVGVVDEGDVFDDSATVRVKSHNQHDRRLLNKWWKEHLNQLEKQRIFHVLIGEECGTLTFDPQPVTKNEQYGQLV